MRQSKLFTKLERTAPKDEVALNAQFLTRGGFVYKNSAGVYSFLPLGLRVLRKISDIVRGEMNAIDGQEVAMPALNEKHYLKATGRWDVDVVYKAITGDEKEPSFNISWTNEEMMSEIAARYVNSYKDLPFAAYQIQSKFRHEPRAKSGLLRGREFLMKDLYSFHVDEKNLYEYYARATKAYHAVFEKCGLHAIYTLAAGGEFTASNTHEFQVVSDVGEDTIYICDKCEYAENDEISTLKEGDICPKCGVKDGGRIEAKKAIEVGNIFPLGTKYAEAFNLKFKDENGEEKFVVMGSYGIGISRLIGVIIEKFNDENGVIWPESVAPFKVHLLSLAGADASHLYEHLQRIGIEVLYDDRDVSAGEKFAGADLIGIPWRVVVSPKLGDEKIEIKKRDEKESKVMTHDEFFKLLTT